VKTERVIRQQKSFCRICLAACGIVVDVDDETDEILTVRGDATHPLSEGYLCPKGRALGTIHARDRLDGAYLGRGTDRVPATVEDAVADLARRLRHIVDEHGPGAIASFSGSGTFSDPMGGWAVGTLKRGLGISQSYSTNTVDAVAKVFVGNLVAGTSALFPQPDPATRLMLYVGSNPVVSHGQSIPIPNPIRRIRAVQEHGQVWVIDPRRTETAALADGHVAVRPGTDHAVLAYLVRAVLAGGVDRQALAERAEGSEELEAIVARFDRDSVAALTGADPERLEALAAAVLDAGRLAVVTGTGLTMSRGGNVGEWMAWALSVVTDSFDQGGGMWFNPGYQFRLDLRDRPIRPGRYDRSGPPSRPDLLSFNGEWPAALIAEEIRSGRLKALLVTGANPALALPTGADVAGALGSLDILAAFDITATATTDLATHAFGCADQLERPDLGSLELFGGAVYTQYTDAVVPPRPDRPEMWRVIAKVARQLGVEVLDAADDLDAVATDEVMVRTRRGFDLDALRQADGPVIAETEVFGWVQARLPYGRWRLAPAELVAQLEALPTVPAYVVAPRRQLRRMNGLRYGEERPTAMLHPSSAEHFGVVDGEVVEVASASGVLRLAAQVTEAVAPGVVSVPHGWREANVNVLTSSTDLDPYTGMPVLSGTEVVVRPVRA
jgi:anaerobic selenocysteine-containing dehydrogenase